MAAYDDQRLGLLDVYRYRTAEKIAAFCDAEKSISAYASDQEAVRDQLQTQALPLYQDAYERYLTEGTASSIYAACFVKKGTVSDQQQITSFLVYQCREQVDPIRLQSAVDMAVIRHPYVLMNVSLPNGDRRAVHYHKNPKPLAVTRAGVVTHFGADENNGHFAVVSYQDSIIRFSISHLITDLYGTNKFVQSVLHQYFGTEDMICTDSEYTDYAADLMSCRLPLPKEYCMHFPAVQNRFEPPEADGKALSETVFICSSDLAEFAKRCALTMQAVTMLLLAATVQRTHPDNRFPVCIRGPVNTRPFLNVPHTFQNASIPHVFVSFDADQLICGSMAALSEQTVKQMEQQYNYPYLAGYTNRIARFVLSDDQAELAELVHSTRSQTRLFASYVGDLADRDFADKFSSVRMEGIPFYPIMLYAYQFGDMTGLHLAQTFPSRGYLNSMLNVLREWDIRWCSNEQI